MHEQGTHCPTRWGQRTLCCRDCTSGCSGLLAPLCAKAPAERGRWRERAIAGKCSRCLVLRVLPEICSERVRGNCKVVRIDHVPETLLLASQTPVRVRIVADEAEIVRASEPAHGWLADLANVACRGILHGAGSLSKLGRGTAPSFAVRRAEARHDRTKKLRADQLISATAPEPLDTPARGESTIAAETTRGEGPHKATKW